MRRFTNLERAQVQQADVNDLLRDAIALLRSELERPKVEVKVDFNDLRPLNCKPQQLCSVFLGTSSKCDGSPSRRRRNPHQQR